MTRRYGVSLLATVIAGLLPLAAAGQPAEGSGPRTPWGDPDLQGVWTSATYTPLERPETLGARAFLTEEEAAQLAALVAEDGVDPLRARGVLAAETDEERQAVTRQTQENIHYDNAVWLTEEQRKTFSTRRTSLIVDPPDGRIPPRVPEAVEREAKRRQASRHLVYNIDEPSYEGYHTRTLQERCLVWRHEGPPMVPPSYNDMLQIFQTPDHVVVMQEMSNNPPRIIPLDQPHLPSRIRQWPGDSRGRWKGDTLVVDTVNFNEKTHYEGSTEALRVVERFTRVDAETIRYEFTVQDDRTWARPWSVEFPLMKREGPLYEYACHEGNHDIRHILEVARNVERQAAEAAQDGDNAKGGSR